MSEAAPALGTEPVLRVLLCDDDPVMSEALRGVMASSEGVEVVGVASDADSAASLAETLVPDVILLDVRMPGGGGPRAARLIRRRVRNARLIAFSAHSDRQTVLSMLRAGASEFLVKGIDSDVDILEAMRRTGRGRLGLSQPQSEELALDLVDLLATTEARLAAANNHLLHLGEDARASAEAAIGQVQSALGLLQRRTTAEAAQASAALEEALARLRPVVDALAAATVVATTHAVDADPEGHP